MDVHSWKWLAIDRTYHDTLVSPSCEVRAITGRQTVPTLYVVHNGDDDIKEWDDVFAWSFLDTGYRTLQTVETNLIGNLEHICHPYYSHLGLKGNYEYYSRTRWPWWQWIKYQLDRPRLLFPRSGWLLISLCNTTNEDIQHCLWLNSSVSC
jgi:hypothetical protein